jgi:hypothetical protein
VSEEIPLSHTPADQAAMVVFWEQKAGEAVHRMGEALERLKIVERQRDVALRYMRRAAPPARQAGGRAQALRWHFGQIEQALTGMSWSGDNDEAGV